MMRAVLLALMLINLPTVAFAEDPACGGITTMKEAYAPKYFQQASKFLADLQAAVRANDRKRVANLVRYPLRAYGSSGRIHISKPVDLITHYDLIFTPEIKRVILSQTASCLWYHETDIAIGASGELWFAAASEGTPYKLITVNGSAQ